MARRIVAEARSHDNEADPCRRRILARRRPRTNSRGACGCDQSARPANSRCVVGSRHEQEPTVRDRIRSNRGGRRDHLVACAHGARIPTGTPPSGRDGSKDRPRFSSRGGRWSRVPRRPVRLLGSRLAMRPVRSMRRRRTACRRRVPRPPVRGSMRGAGCARSSCQRIREFRPVGSRPGTAMMAT
jgi:hypothetical protein